MGSMRQRGNGWELKAYFGVDPSTGKQVFRYKHVDHPQTTAGKKAAKRDLVRFEAELLDQEFDSAASAHLSTGFEAFALRWWQDNVDVGRWTPGYAKNVKGQLNGRLLPSLGRLELDEIRPHQIQKLFTDMAAEGLKASSIRRYSVTLNRIFKRAVLWDVIDVNPMTKVELPKEQPSERNAPNLEQTQAALTWVAERDFAFYTYLALGCDTGARASSLLGLQWGDIDWEGDTIHFRRVLVEGFDGYETRLGSKNGKTYTTPLTPEMAGILDTWKVISERDLGSAADGEHLFRSKRSPKHWAPTSPGHMWNRYRPHFGLEDYTLHEATRHFVATQMLDDGVPLQTVAQQLNHANVATTSTVYSHYIKGANQEAAARHSSRLFSSDS